MCDRGTRFRCLRFRLREELSAQALPFVVRVDAEVLDLGLVPLDLHHLDRAGDGAVVVTVEQQIALALQNLLRVVLNGQLVLRVQ